MNIYRFNTTSPLGYLSQAPNQMKLTRDEFDWMHDLSSQRVLKFLQEENDNFDLAMRPLRSLETEIFEEVVSRLPINSDTVPYKYGEYWYRMTYLDNSEYPCYQRSLRDSPFDWEILLDFRTLAKGHATCDVQVCIDRQSRVLAYAVDTNGDRIYTIFFKDLATGSILPHSLTYASGCMAFSKCGNFLFFVELDRETLRWRWIKRYKTGTDPVDTETVFEELDEAFSCSVYSSKGDHCLFLCSSSGEEDEVQFLLPDRSYSSPQMIAVRTPNHQYTVQFDGSEFIIRTNRDAINFRLMTAKLEDPSLAGWKLLWQPEPEAYLEDFDITDTTIIVNERVNCTTRLLCIRRSDLSVAYRMPLLDNSVSVVLRDNFELNAAVIRYEKSSYIEPPQICELDLQHEREIVVKTIDFEDSFQSSQYICRQHLVLMPDGCQVPMSLLCRNGDQDIAGPTLVYVYGAYGYSVDPYILPPRFSLIDRGFRIAIAHVRGGGELGTQWHYAGRALNKATSISDFVECCVYLRKSQLSTNLYAMGESAGGVVVGAALNQRPELFAGVVAIAPFVDFLNTLSDPSIPLTTLDYGEWGDPNQPKDYQYMLSYAPYQNLRPLPYPHALAMISLQDTQVPSWEAAKWIARMRMVTTSTSQQFIKTEFLAGHMGRSGRTEQYRDLVIAYTFLLGLEQNSIG